MSLCGCFSLGTTRLYEDQLGYSRALGDAEKSDTLLNVVRIRYADTPIFLQATQVISGYQLQRNVTGGFEAFPAANPSTFLKRQRIGAAPAEPDLHIPAAFRGAIRAKLHSSPVAG